MEELKGSEISVVKGTGSETGAFQQCYLFRLEKKTERPLFIQFVTERAAVLVAA